MTATRASHEADAPLEDAVIAAALLALAPDRFGGAVLRGAVGEACERWIALVQVGAPSLGPIVRVPRSATAAALNDGIDLAETLRTGRCIVTPGLIADAGRRAIVLPSGERWTPAEAARLLAARDATQRADGCAAGPLLVLDEGVDGERPPDVLLERLAFQVDLTNSRTGPATTLDSWQSRVEQGRARLPHVNVPDEIMAGISKAAVALGIGSLRADAFAISAARAHAAWRGALVVEDWDAVIAARLVLAPRARQLPEAASRPEQAPSEPPPERTSREPAAASTAEAGESSGADQDTTADRLLAATRAALPADLLARLGQRGASGRGGQRSRAGGRSGARERARRGRPIGAMAGDPRHDGPLDLLATVAAAAPWQKMRCQQGTHVRRSRVERRLRIERSDLRVTRFRNHKPSTIIIAVDASGSAALHRLGEAKGAVELLLSECYVRRDKVALIAFRGIRADVLLPPTRSLVRAKRELAGLPGGGTTPLACGIDRARKLALVELRAGHDCRVVLLTDGRCNIDRSGAPGRVKALADAEHAARQLVADHVPCLMIDTSRRGNEQAATLAALMAAPYLPLPHAEAHDLAHRIRRSDARR